MGATPSLRLWRPSSRVARCDVAATVVSSPVPTSVPDIIQFVRGPQLLGLSLSPAQETLLRAIYGLPLTLPQRELWQLWHYIDGNNRIMQLSFGSPVGGAVSDLSVAAVCAYGQYNRSKLFGIGLNTPEEAVIEHLGQPDSESIDKDGLEKLVFFKKWNAVFGFSEGRVTDVCVSAGPIGYEEEYGE